MNIFSPYTVIQHLTGNVIELELPLWRKRLNFILYRILPFVLLLLMVNVYVSAKEEMPDALLITLTVGILVLLIIMLLKKYVVKVSISKTGIEVHQKTLGGESIVFISTNEVERIFCKVRVGKSGGTFFYVKPTFKKKIEFITIPVLNMNAEHTLLIKEELKKIIGVNCETI